MTDTTDQPVDYTAGRQPRSLQRLRTMLLDRGWYAAEVAGSTELYRHPDSPGELLTVPGRPGSAAYNAQYDAALDRLLPLPPTATGGGPDPRIEAVARRRLFDEHGSGVNADTNWQVYELDAAELVAAADLADPIRAWLRAVLAAEADQL